MRSPLLGFEKPTTKVDPFKNTPEQTIRFNARRMLKIVEGDLWDEEWFIGLPEEGNSSNSSLFQLSSSIEKTERSAISVVLASLQVTQSFFFPTILRALSKSQNWPAGPWSDKSLWQRKKHFSESFCWKQSLSYKLFRIWLIWLDSFD